MHQWFCCHKLVSACSMNCSATEAWAWLTCFVPGQYSSKTLDFQLILKACGASECRPILKMSAQLGKRNLAFSTTSGMHCPDKQTVCTLPIAKILLFPASQLFLCLVQVSMLSTLTALARCSVSAQQMQGRPWRLPGTLAALGKHTCIQQVVQPFPRTELHNKYWEFVQQP